MAKASFSIRDDILGAASQLRISIKEIGATEARQILDRLLELFGANDQFELTPANLANPAAVQHPDSAQWVGEFLSDESVFFFYDCYAQHGMFRLEHGNDVAGLLAELGGFEFCVANESLSYVICQNHHDYLMAVGSAKTWVETLQPRHDEWVRSLPPPPLKVFLDDERPAPEGWTVARWPDDVIALLKTGKVAALSLDHDLGDDTRTGYDVLLWLEAAVVVDGFTPPRYITIHSANAGARGRMELAIESIQRHARKAGDRPE